MSERAFAGALLTSDDRLQERILSLWPASVAKWRVFNNGAEAVENILNSLPDIFITSMDLPDTTGPQVITLVKSENVYRQVQTFLCLTQEEFDNKINLEDIECDDYFLLSGSDKEFKARITLALQRAYRGFDANPLTRLPGNTSIIRYVQNRIERYEDFAMCYCDLDYFKSFNDKYGFTRGDEVLMMTARIILNIVRSLSPKDFFVGHVGGDDFVFVVPLELAETACQQIIQSFDAIIPQFYDTEDRLRGGIISTDRQGVVRSFPLIAISIAVVINENNCLDHVGKASSIAMNLKKKAKESVKSCYVIDRRNGSM